jgi:hypothetical protein
MEFPQNSHFLALKGYYELVGNKTWESNEFAPEPIDKSRGLFTKESLLSKYPVPKELEVYALLSGIEFERKTACKLADLQEKISAILGSSLHYWVRPENLGVEYCVFKWPDGPWSSMWTEQTATALESVVSEAPPFLFSVFGIQINPDGCVVAKGYDENASIFCIRRALQSSLEFLPEKQSGWAHVPMGRILEPVGSEKFEKLRSYIKCIKDEFIVSQKISSVKFVHETQWYMEKKTVLSELLFE